MPERADLLGKHPVEHAFFATIAPSPDPTLGVKRNWMILSCSEIFYLNVLFC